MTTLQRTAQQNDNLVKNAQRKVVDLEATLRSKAREVEELTKVLKGFATERFEFNEKITSQESQVKEVTQRLSDETGEKILLRATGC